MSEDDAPPKDGAPPKGGQSPADLRRQRLSKALRRNLRRRKEVSPVDATGREDDQPAKDPPDGSP